MKEEQFKQLSLFDDEEAEEQASTNQEYSIKDIRYTLYKKFYSFSQVKELIDFLLKIEFEEYNFEKSEFLALLLELSFDNLKEDISSINTFEDLYNKRIPELEEEDKINLKKYEEYNEKISNFLNDCCIYSEEQGNFNINVNSYFEASANIIELEKFLNSLPESAKKSRLYDEQLKDLERIKGKKEQAFKFLNDLTTRKELPFDIIYKYNDLLNKMLEETNFEYLSGYEASDYLQALYYVNAGIRENNPETSKFIEFFNSGLQMIKDYLKKTSESGEDQQSPFDFEIEETSFEDKDKDKLNEDITKRIDTLLKKLRNCKDQKEAEDLQEKIQTLENFRIAYNQKEEFQATERLTRKLLFNGALEDIYSGEGASEVKEFNKIKVNYEFELIDNQGNFLTEEYKPIVDSVFSWYEVNGKKPFSILQLYELNYNKPFRNESKQNIDNLNNLEEALDKMRFLTMRIHYTQEVKLDDKGTTEEHSFKYFNYFLPMKKLERRITRKSHGKEVYSTSDSFYQIIDIPPLYQYAQAFEIEDKSSGMLLTYNIEDYLKGNTRIDSTPKNKLIEEMLIRRIILIKSGKIGNKLNYSNFFEDYCGINYSILSKKTKDQYRKKVKTVLTGFKECGQIKNFKEYKLNGKTLSGIEITY